MEFNWFDPLLLFIIITPITSAIVALFIINKEPKEKSNDISPKNINNTFERSLEQ